MKLSYKAKDSTDKYCAYISPDACFRFSIYLSTIFPRKFFIRQEGKFLQANVYKILKSSSSAGGFMYRRNVFSVESLGVEL